MKDKEQEKLHFYLTQCLFNEFSSNFPKQLPGSYDTYKTPRFMGSTATVFILLSRTKNDTCDLKSADEDRTNLLTSALILSKKTFTLLGNVPVCFIASKCSNIVRLIQRFKTTLLNLY